LEPIGTKKGPSLSADQGWTLISRKSKLLAAAAYNAPRRRLYLRFHSGEVYSYFTFPAEQYQEFLDAESRGRYFLNHIRNQFPYERLPRR
jgi:hypothetical protein